jgi:CRISPR-associated protein Cmr4
LAIYGPEPETADSDKQHAGALIVSDARLLALPVRSFCGVFAWVSSPLLLSLLERDIQMARESGVFHQEIPVPGQEQQVVADLDQSIIIHTIKEPIGQEDKAKAKDKVFLEDLDLDVCSSPEQIKQLRAWSDYLDKWVMPPSQRGAFSKRFVVVSDEVMAFLWETATQVDTRIRLDTDTRTVARGALWTEESLPPETLLCGVLAAENSRMPSHALRASEVLDEALTEERVLQFGGKSTIGRGRCRMIPGLSALF